MGLLEALGLGPTGNAATARRGVARESAGAEVDAGPTADDESGTADRVAAAHDAIAELLKKLDDGDKARDGLENELAGLRAKHAGLADGKRAAAEKAELAAAAALSARVGKLADKADQARDLETTRALAETGLSSINAMVLSVIANDALRTSVNGELTKLKAAQEKAAKIAEPKAALAGWKALLLQVQALQKKAEGARDASTADGDVAPLFAAAKAAIAAVPGAAKAKLDAEWTALDGERQRYLQASDSTSLQTIVKPRISKLADLAKALPGAAAKVDAALARAAAALNKLDGDAARPLKDRLKALQDERAGDWPAGMTIDEMAASFDRVAKGGEALAREAEGLGPKLGRQKEIAILRKRLDGLKPRLDRAAGPAEAKAIEFLHKRVVTQLAQFATYEAAADLKSCEILFSSIGATLDSIDDLGNLIRACKARFAAAKNGGVKAALGVKLEPASLAALRQKAIDDQERDIAAMIDGGNLVAADKAVESWLASAKTWGEAPAAYANLRSGKPQKKVMTDLIGKPGGGKVFDALVADLPDGKTDEKNNVSTETMQLAIEARFGTKVRQFDHRNPGEDQAKKDASYPKPREETKPGDPQKGLKDLYKILRMVPVNDVRFTESIHDYAEDAGGAVYQSGASEWAKGGSKKDTIAMYCGRPEQPDTMKLGGTNVRGQEPDKDAQPNDSNPVNEYTQSALHEVAHGLDDAKNVMAKHMDEAGWQAWSVTDVAKKVAAFHSYDSGYVEALLTKDPTAPPAKPPRPKSVKTDADWENGRKAVTQWAIESRVSAKPWNVPGFAKNNAIGGRVFTEASEGEWYSYHLAARARGIRNYQFRSPSEWFAELYAAFYLGKLQDQHPSAKWLRALKAESEAA